MNWSALERDPLWQELWQSKEVQEMVEAIRAKLLRGSDVDPHTIGLLRGQLAAFDRLRMLVTAKANKERELELVPAPEQKRRLAGIRRLFGVNR